MRNVPVILSGFRLMVVGEKVIKTRENEKGEVEEVEGSDGAKHFTVPLFVKQRAVEGRHTPKGEEINVTLECDPGEGFREGTYVELIDPRVSPWGQKRGEGVASGLAIRAAGMTPVN